MHRLERGGGSVSAFAFFSGVPLSILYDNTTVAVAKKILGDGKGHFSGV
jgi:transposase